MPTYGYRCDNCKNEFDVRQSFDSEPRYECPKCQHIAKRQFHAPPVIYKGSGFYTTDYARKDKGTANTSTGSSSNSSSSSDSSSSSSSDSAKSTSTTSDSSGSSSSSSSSGSDSSSSSSSTSKPASSD